MHEAARRRCTSTRKEATIALNRDRIGHRYPAYHYEVSREKIREYAVATGVSDAMYMSDPAEVPSSEIVAPPTFAACFTIGGGASLFTDAELGAHPALVHGSQAYEYQRPVRPGDVLECTPWIADISYRGRNEFLTLQIDCVDHESKEPVLTSRATIVFLGSAPTDATEG